MNDLEIETSTDLKNSIITSNSDTIQNPLIFSEKLQSESKKVGLEQFDPIKVIGEGSFGKVMLVKHKFSQKYYALKTLRKDKIKKSSQITHVKSERKSFY